MINRKISELEIDPNITTNTETVTVNNNGSPKTYKTTVGVLAVAIASIIASGGYLASTILSGSVHTYCATVGSSKADYITDGIADDVQINQAIVDCNASGGGTVKIQNGNYDISSNTVRFYSGVYIEGSGKNTILKRSASSSLTRVAEVRISTGVTSTTNFGIKNLTIDSNESEPLSGHYGLVLGQGTVPSFNVIVEDIDVLHASKIGINAYNIDGLIMKNIRVFSAQQIVLSDGIDVVLSKNFYLSNIYTESGDDGLVLSNSSNGFVNGTYASGTVAGGAFRVGQDSTTSTPSHDITATNIRCNNCDSTVSISNVQTQNVQMHNIAISNVISKDSSNAIKFDIQNGMQDGVTLPIKNIVINNVLSERDNRTFFSSATHTVDGLLLSNVKSVSSTGYAFEIQSCKNCTFSDIEISSSTASSIAIVPPNEGYVENIIFNNVVEKGSQDRGFLAYSPTYIKSNININNSSFDGNGNRGLDLSGMLFNLNNVKANNNIDHGIIFNPTTEGIDATSTFSDLDINNNTGYGFFTYNIGGKIPTIINSSKMYGNLLGSTNITIPDLDLTSNGYRDISGKSLLRFSVRDGVVFQCDSINCIARNEWLPWGDSQYDLGRSDRRWEQLWLSSIAIINGTTTADGYSNPFKLGQTGKVTVIYAWAGTGCRAEIINSSSTASIYQATSTLFCL